MSVRLSRSHGTTCTAAPIPARATTASTPITRARSLLDIVGRLLLFAE